MFRDDERVLQACFATSFVSVLLAFAAVLVLGYGLFSIHQTGQEFVQFSAHLRSVVGRRRSFLWFQIEAFPGIRSDLSVETRLTFRTSGKWPTLSCADGAVVRKSGSGNDGVGGHDGFLSEAILVAAEFYRILNPLRGINPEREAPLNQLLRPAEEQDAQAHLLRRFAGLRGAPTECTSILSARSRVRRCLWTISKSRTLPIQIAP